MKVKEIIFEDGDILPKYIMEDGSIKVPTPNFKGLFPILVWEDEKYINERILKHDEKPKPWYKRL